MSFRCEGPCGEPQPPLTPMKVVATAVREVIHETTLVLVSAQPRGDRVGKALKTRSSTGYEIARTVKMCPSCAAEAPEPEVVGSKTIQSRTDVKRRKRDKKDEDE